MCYIYSLSRSLFLSLVVVLSSSLFFFSVSLSRYDILHLYVCAYSCMCCITQHKHHILLAQKKCLPWAWKEAPTSWEWASSRRTDRSSPMSATLISRPRVPALTPFSLGALASSHGFFFCAQVVFCICSAQGMWAKTGASVRGCFHLWVHLWRCECRVIFDWSRHGVPAKGDGRASPQIRRGACAPSHQGTGIRDANERMCIQELE